MFYQSAEATDLAMSLPSKKWGFVSIKQKEIVEDKLRLHSTWIKKVFDEENLFEGRRILYLMFHIRLEVV